MSALHDPDIIRRVLDALERRIPAIIRANVPRQQYGVVFSTDPTNRKAAVNLYGQDEPADGFVYGEVIPREGDHVRVVVGLRGDRYIDAVLGRVPRATAESVSALPTASADIRGQFVLVTGATGVADGVYVCGKDATDAYVWLAVA